MSESIAGDHLYLFTKEKEPYFNKIEIEKGELSLLKNSLGVEDIYAEVELKILYENLDFHNLMLIRKFLENYPPSSTQYTTTSKSKRSRRNTKSIPLDSAEIPKKNETDKFKSIKKLFKVKEMEFNSKKIAFFTIMFLLIFMLLIFGPKSLDILILPLIIVLYFLPALVAEKRKHPSKNSITVVNIFLGWTLLGWVFSLAWALNNPLIVINETTTAHQNLKDLEKLAELRDKKIITEKEFLDKKKDLLK